MLVLLSPSKKLEENSVLTSKVTSIPEFIKDTEELVTGLKKLSSGEISDLMKLSIPLSNLNHKRFQEFNFPFTTNNAKPALFTFKGDVYDKMDVDDYNEADLIFAQEHVRILSGLYGLLKPLDLMQPYRLEMGRKFKNERSENLYGFWGNKLTDSINNSTEEPIINLASIEYFKAVKAKELKAPLINIIFKQRKNGQLKTIGLMAKRARGLMTNFIIKNKVTNIKDLQKFSDTGYSFVPEMSDDKNWVFTMDMEK